MKKISQFDTGVKVLAHKFSNSIVTAEKRHTYTILSFLGCGEMTTSFQIEVIQTTFQTEITSTQDQEDVTTSTESPTITSSQLKSSGASLVSLDATLIWLVVFSFLSK